jgi:hypothetical protein
LCHHNYCTLAHDLILILLLLIHVVLCISGLPDCGSVMCKCFILYIMALRDYCVRASVLDFNHRLKQVVLKTVLALTNGTRCSCTFFMYDALQVHSVALFDHVTRLGCSLLGVRISSAPAWHS